MPETTVARPAWRAAVALAALLVALLGLLVLIGSRPHDPVQLVRQSQELYRDLPAFDMTVRYSDGDVRRFRYDGEGRQRTDLVVGEWEGFSEGSWMIDAAADGRAAEYRADVGVGILVTISPGLGPAPRLDLRWGRIWGGYTWGAEVGATGHPCKSWTIVGADEIAGRATDHLQCQDDRPGRGADVWIDRETRLLLASTDVPAGPLWNERMHGEAISVELAPQFDPSVFAIPEAGDGAWGALMEGGDKPFTPGERYLSAGFEPAFTVRPGEGWRSWGVGPDVVGFVRGGPPDGANWAGLWLLRLSRVTDPETGRDVPLGASVEDLVEWITTHPYFETGNPEPFRVGGVSGLRVPFRERLPEGFDERCPPGRPHQDPEPCRRLFPNGTGYWTYGFTHDAAFIGGAETPGGTVAVIALMDGDVEGHRAAIEEMLATVDFER